MPGDFRRFRVVQLGEGEGAVLQGEGVLAFEVAVEAFEEFREQAEGAPEQAAQERFDHWATPMSRSLMATPTISTDRMPVVTTLITVRRTVLRASRQESSRLRSSPMSRAA